MPRQLLDWLASSSPTDWLVAIATVFAAIFATAEVFKWKREHAGKERYVAAKELIASVYSYRDSLKAIRDPLRQPDDYPEAYRPEKLMEAEFPKPGASEADWEAAKKLQKERLARDAHKAHRAVRETRFSRAGNAFRQAKDALSKAEVVLGDATPDLSPLYDLHREIAQAWEIEDYRLYVVASSPEDEHRSEMESFKKYRSEKEWPHERTSQNDDFERQLDAAVRKIRNSLKQFLPLP